MLTTRRGVLGAILAYWEILLDGSSAYADAVVSRVKDSRE
jgi:hypothetical protein